MTNLKDTIIQVCKEHAEGIPLEKDETSNYIIDFEYEGLLITYTAYYTVTEPKFKGDYYNPPDDPEITIDGIEIETIELKDI